MKRSRIFGSVGLVFLIFVLVMSAFAVADNSTNSTTSILTTTDITTSSSTNQTAISNGYQCLQNLVNNQTTSTLSFQEAVFATLALGNQNILQQEINDQKDGSNYCWPAGACKIKDTSQVLLAYQRTGQSTTNVENWLLSQNSTDTNDLDWFLEIDVSSENSSQCTLTYNSNQYTINIGSDMTINGNPGSCFSPTQNGYWLLFNPNCYGKQVQVSCDQDFSTSLLYQQRTGTTYYVLPDTQSAAAAGTTSEEVNVQCFKSGGQCDYEGTLWAALALQKLGVDVSSFIPYLIAMEGNYQQYFPSAFLYSLVGSNDQYSDIIQSQQQNEFWKMINTPYSEFYDTSLAMIALSGSSATQLTATQNYLTSIQGQDGCWNNDNLRDTAFLLYSGWPQQLSSSSTSSTSSNLCGSISAQSCTDSVSCLNAGGSVLSNFVCSGFNVCCSTTVAQQSCSAQNGVLCTSSQQCSGNVVPSSDSGTCCVGSCVASNKQTQDTCTPAGGTCRSTCNSNEQPN